MGRGPSIVFGQSLAHGIAVASAVGEPHAAFTMSTQQVSGGSALVRLAFSRFEADGQAERIDQSVNPGRQAAT
jgi:hypothetical protein